jgi:glycosyltransferase involved in cell wall biosynthesis
MPRSLFTKNLEFEEAVRARVAELGLGDAVEFGGFRADLMKFLPRFDCLVVASRAEPFGLVLLEAMRAGVPVVASNAGGVPEIVQDGVNGLLFEPDDAPGLASALGRIALEPATAEHLREGGRRVMEERFSFDAQIEAMQRIFESAA